MNFCQNIFFINILFINFLASYKKFEMRKKSLKIFTSIILVILLISYLTSYLNICENIFYKITYITLLIFALLRMVCDLNTIDEFDQEQ